MLFNLLKKPEYEYALCETSVKKQGKNKLLSLQKSSFDQILF